MLALRSQKTTWTTGQEQTPQTMTSNHPISINDLVGSNISPVAVEEAKAVVEDIAALNGVFTDKLLQRAEGPQGDRDIKRLIASNSNLKTIASNATYK